MATTNFVHLWKDGDRLFVDVNGATIEAQSLTFEQQVVTLRFQARVAPLKALATGIACAGAVRGVENDPLYDEGLW